MASWTADFPFSVDEGTTDLPDEEERPTSLPIFQTDRLQLLPPEMIQWKNRTQSLFVYRESCKTNALKGKKQSGTDIVTQIRPSMCDDIETLDVMDSKMHSAVSGVR